ncbi:hypothetical protein [Rhizobium leguminosarum]|uniref:hypothetical protein n=1 Tax=Rhizobium leguminosarum TaxID=384 RepID=UPI003F9A2DEA
MSVTPVPDDVLCRVLVADQFPLSLSPAGWPHDDKAKEVPPPFEAVSHMKTMNLAAVVADNPGCARDIVAQQFHVLPNQPLEDVAWEHRLR